MLYDPKWEPKEEVEIKIQPWQQILIDAINTFNERGWAQWNMQTDKGAVCSIGAFRFVQHGNSKRRGQPCNYATKDMAKAKRKLDEVILEEGDYTTTVITSREERIMSWNDARWQTKKSVIAAFKKAANLPKQRPVNPRHK